MVHIDTTGKRGAQTEPVDINMGGYRYPSAGNIHRLASRQKEVYRQNLSRWIDASASCVATGCDWLSTAGSPWPKWSHRGVDIQKPRESVLSSIGKEPPWRPLWWRFRSLVRAIRLSIEQVDVGLEAAAKNLGGRAYPGIFHSHRAFNYAGDHYRGHFSLRP